MFETQWITYQISCFYFFQQENGFEEAAYSGFCRGSTEQLPVRNS